MVACAAVALLASCVARSEAAEGAGTDRTGAGPKASGEERAASEAGAAGQGARGAQLSDEELSLNRRPLRLPLAAPKIVVEKRARRLTLYSGGAAVRVYAVVLGFAPEGDKEKQGDGRTPEGAFRVCTKNERSRFYLSLGLDYPRVADAERGLRSGLITRAEAVRIRRAAARGACPPWNTALGGEIFIHGGGTASDWTAGCVALENEQIRELFDVVPIGTAVLVEP
jgi:hypothetical protein